MVCHLLALFSIVLALKTDCPIWVCDTLPDLTCGSVVGNIVYLNEKGCAWEACNKVYVYNEYLKMNETSAFIPCITDPYYTAVYPETVNYYVDCPIQNSDANLANGTDPKICLTDDDCLLQDGTKSECVCGMDGNYYCAPDISSELFGDF